MRLNAEIRRKIISACKDDLFGEQLRQLRQERAAWASTVYRCAVSEEQELDMRTAGRATTPYFYCSMRTTDADRAQSVYVYFGDGIEYPIPEGVRNRIVTNEQLFDENHRLTQAERKIQRDMSVVDAKLYELLTSVTTDKRLKEVWPAGAKYIPDAVAVVKTDDKAKNIAAEVTNLMVDFGMEVEA